MHNSITTTVTLAAASAPLVLGSALLCRHILRRRFLHETTGRLVGWKQEFDALVSFHGEDGSQHQLVTTVLAAAKPNMEIGQPFPTPVVYDARHPERARIGRMSYLWIAPFVWLVIGSCALALTSHGRMADSVGRTIDGIERRIARIDMADALGALGFVMATLGTGMLIRRIVFFRRSRKTLGKLVGWKEERKWIQHRLVTFRSAVVSFQAPDGSMHEVVSDWATGTKARVRIGHSFPVRYNPRDPREAHVSTMANLWAKPLVFLLIGGVLLHLFG